MGVFMWVPNRGDDLAHLGELIETGEMAPVIDRRFPLNEVPDAVGHLASGNARGKVLVTF